MSRLKDKRILVTGASSGIGAAFCRIAAQEGAAIVGVARRRDRLAELQTQLGDAFSFAALDLEQRNCTPEIEKLGRFDGALCNAGRGSTRMPLEVDEILIEQMMRANVYSVINTVQGVLPEMKKARHGHIMITGSILGRYPYAPWRIAYSAAKAALASIAANWRHSLHPMGLTVTMINPGLTDTEFQQVANPEAEPLPRLNTASAEFPSVSPQTSEEVARVIADNFFTSKDEVYTRPEIGEWMAETSRLLTQGYDRTKGLLSSN